MCNKEFIWNLSNCECEYDKSCDVGEYLDYENCKCRRKLVHKSVEECTENVEEVKLAKEAKNKHKCSSCTLYIVLFSIILTVNVGIDACFIYYKCMNHWYPKKRVTRIRFGTRAQTTIMNLMNL